MSCSDIINASLAILSFVLAAISIVTVVITIRQNNRMLEANERPYVVAYLVYEEYSTNLYFCVKNFGHASAIVESLVMIPDIKVHNKTCSELFENTMIAPGQQFHFWISSEEKDRIIGKSEYIHTIKIVYTDCTTQKRYKEEYNINTEYVTEIGSTRNTLSKYNNMENSLHNIEKAITFMKNQTF